MSVNLKERLLTAVILIAVLGTCVYMGINYPENGWLALMSLFLFAVMGAANEFTKICQAGNDNKYHWQYFLLVLLPVVISLVCLIGCNRLLSCCFGCVTSATIVAFIFAVLFMMLAARKTLDAASNIAQDIFVGILLIGFGGGSLVCLSGVNVNALLWLVLVACVNDSAAYFTGRHIGGPLMAPIVSPKKTISGCIGGYIGGILTGYFAMSLLPEMTVCKILLLSFIVVFFSQLGDLAKSYVKRLHNTKDSGNFLPGHGGILDRIDAMLMSSPVVVWWLIHIIK